VIGSNEIFEMIYMFSVTWSFRNYSYADLLVK